MSSFFVALQQADYRLTILVKRAFLKISRRDSFSKVTNVRDAINATTLEEKNAHDRVFDRVIVC